MPVEIVYDSPEEAERGQAIRDGHVYADIEDGVIRVSWSNHMDGLGSYSNPLKELGGKKVTNTGGYLALSLTNCKGMREHYGKRLHISDELNDWAFDEIERLGSIENLSAASSDAQLSAAFKLAAPAIARVAHPYQRAGIAFCAATARGLLADQPGLGKAQPVSEPVLTPSGWVKMGDLHPGSMVVGSNGKPTEVLAVYPQGEREVVKVTFSDGTVVRCDWDHLWQVRTKDHRRAGLPGWSKTARELAESGLYIENGTRRRFDIPMTAPVEFDSKSYPLDAYTVGALIGDGSLSTDSWVSITTDHEVVANMTLPSGSSTKLTEVSWHWGTYRINGLARHLRELGLNGTKAESKAIPEPLMQGSVEDRIALLQGLLDTDGTTVQSRGSSRGTTIEYGTVSRTLSRQVRELVQLLGGVASIQEKTPTYTYKGEKREGQVFYRMVLSLPSPIVPFRLQRKLDKWEPRSKYEPHRSIVSIEGTGEYEQAQCIRVAAEDSLYITTAGVVTHNTLQTIGTMIEADVSGDILVLAPTAAVAITWPDELRTWVPNDEVVCVVGQGRQRHKLLQDTLSVDPIGKRRWIIANLEMARAQWVKPTKEYRKPKVGDGEKRWFNVPGWWSYSYPELFGEFKDGDEIVETPPWAAVVVDESHRCLIAKTGTLQGQTQIRAGMAQIPVAEDGIKLALSGTPMRGKPENLWGTLNWLYPDRYSSYWNWARRWFVVWGEDASKAGEIEGLDESKAKDFYDDIKSIMLRRTKKEVRPELPDKLYAGTPLPDENGEITDDSPVGHWVHMSPKQKKAYEDMQQNSETLLDSGILVANGVLAELTRLKQFATCFGDLEHYIDSRGDDAYKFIPKLPSAKFDWIVDFLETLGINKDSSVEPDEDEEVRKVVIASQFTSVLDLYDAELQRLGIKTLKITGKVSQKQRKIAKDTWQEEGGPRVFLLNTQAGGVSLTLDAADDLVFLDETWIPDDQEQVEDRIHRVSRMHQVTIHYLRTLGTVEENIALTTGSRERITKMLIDGQRGVSFARKLLTPIKRAA